MSKRERFNDHNQFRGFLQNWDPETFFYGQSINASALANWAQENFGEGTVVGMELLFTSEHESISLNKWQREYAELEAPPFQFNKWIALQLLDQVLAQEDAA
jgi:hypothetical protein